MSREIDYDKIIRDVCYLAEMEWSKVTKFKPLEDVLIAVRTRKSSDKIELFCVTEITKKMTFLVGSDSPMIYEVVNGKTSVQETKDEKYKYLLITDSEEDMKNKDSPIKMVGCSLDKSDQMYTEYRLFVINNIAKVVRDIYDPIPSTRNKKKLTTKRTSKRNSPITHL